MSNYILKIGISLGYIEISWVKIPIFLPYLDIIDNDDHKIFKKLIKIFNENSGEIKYLYNISEEKKSDIIKEFIETKPFNKLLHSNKKIVSLKVRNEIKYLIIYILFAICLTVIYSYDILNFFNKNDFLVTYLIFSIFAIWDVSSLIKHKERRREILPKLEKIFNGYNNYKISHNFKDKLAITCLGLFKITFKIINQRNNEQYI